MATEAARRGKPRQTVHRTLASTSPPPLIELRQGLSAIRWETNKRILDIVALISATDRSYSATRAQLLKLFNEEDRTTHLLINRFGVNTTVEDEATQEEATA